MAVHNYFDTDYDAMMLWCYDDNDFYDSQDSYTDNDNRASFETLTCSNHKFLDQTAVTGVMVDQAHSKNFDNDFHEYDGSKSYDDYDELTLISMMDRWIVIWWLWWYSIKTITNVAINQAHRVFAIILINS